MTAYVKLQRNDASGRTWNAQDESGQWIYSPGFAYLRELYAALDRDGYTLHIEN